MECQCLNCQHNYLDLNTRPNYFFDKKISTFELKKIYLSGLIEDFDNKIVIMSFHGEEIPYDYSSVNLLVEQYSNNQY